MAEIEAQGLFDMFKLLDKEMIEKILAISKCIKIERTDGAVRIIIELIENKD